MLDYITKSVGRAQAAANAAITTRHGDIDGPAPTLPTLVVHELRHSHATILPRSGAPVHVVAKRLGQKKPSATLNVYANVIPDDDTSAVDVFRKAVWNA